MFLKNLSSRNSQKKQKIQQIQLTSQTRQNRMNPQTRWNVLYQHQRHSVLTLLTFTPSGSIA